MAYRGVARRPPFAEGGGDSDGRALEYCCGDRPLRSCRCSCLLAAGRGHQRRRRSPPPEHRRTGRIRRSRPSTSVLTRRQRRVRSRPQDRLRRPRPSRSSPLTRPFRTVRLRSTLPQPGRCPSTRRRRGTESRAPTWQSLRPDRKRPRCVRPVHLWHRAPGRYNKVPEWVLRCIDNPAPLVMPGPGIFTRSHPSPTPAAQSTPLLEDFISVFDSQTGKLLLGWNESAS